MRLDALKKSKEGHSLDRPLPRRYCRSELGGQVLPNVGATVGFGQLMPDVLHTGHASTGFHLQPDRRP